MGGGGRGAGGRRGWGEGGMNNHTVTQMSSIGGAIPPSSGVWYQVALGTCINNFMSPTRIAAPVYHVSQVRRRPGLFSGKSIFRRISVLGEGAPFAMVSQTSKPSTGISLESVVPPKKLVEDSLYGPIQFFLPQLSRRKGASLGCEDLWDRTGGKALVTDHNTRLSMQRSHKSSRRQLVSILPIVDGVANSDLLLERQPKVQGEKEYTCY